MIKGVNSMYKYKYNFNDNGHYSSHVENVDGFHVNQEKLLQSFIT
jgi:hypothetical protein